MEYTEIEKIKELVRYLGKWTHDNFSYKNTIAFNQALRIINLQTAVTHELTKHGGYEAAPVTIEEKVKQASFYVVDGSTYKINFHIAEERWFDVSNVEEDNDTFIVRYDSVPADAYFLGTHRL